MQRKINSTLSSGLKSTRISPKLDNEPSGASRYRRLFLMLFAAILIGAPMTVFTQQICAPLQKQVSVDGGITWADADTAATAVTQVFGGDVLFRIIVENCEAEKLCIGTMITDDVLNIPATLIPGGPGLPLGELQPGNQVIVTHLTPGFENLAQPQYCDQLTKENIAEETTTVVRPILGPKLETFTNSAWVNCQQPLPAIELCTLVTLNPDMISGFSDADAIVGDGCDVFNQSIPAGRTGRVDGTYRLKVTNTGPDTLVNVRINAPDFGLTDEPIPAACGDLDPGEMCIVNFDDPNPNYSSLEMPGVCAASGQVTKIATVDGETSGGIPVSDDDPAIVQCVDRPKITLRKEVSLDGGVTFFDANTAAAGPTGLLGANALYRLTVENDGTGTLTNVVITDSTLGLTNVSVPGGPLLEGDIRVIQSGDSGFSALSFPNRCDTVGIHLNTARVDAISVTQGTDPIHSTDPAYVNCENPQIELLKQVSIDGVNFFNADGASDPDVPVGIVGLTDATYRLIVNNLGTELLTNVLIEDADLGISVVITDLLPGESRVIDSGDAGFGNLFQADRCDGAPGNKANMATVNATGANTGSLVSDDDPANLRCIVGPEIELLKQVSLDGVTFFDADTAAAGPTGLLGADATYRLIVRNVGDEDLTNVTLDDTTLGINGVVVPDLPVGDFHVIDVGSFGGFQELFFNNRCDSIGTQLNIASVSAEGAITNGAAQDTNPANVVCVAPVVCDITVDKTCLVAPTSNSALLCTDSIAATTLRYTGPSLSNANVTFQGKDDGFADYVGVNLVSNVTVLTMAGQNGFTVDATIGGGSRFGSQTTITINGVVEIIHTSCSAIYEAGQPAPLDGNTPNPPNSSKGDPSPNWSVVNFQQKDGIFIQAPAPGGQQGADACTVPFGGADVSYAFDIFNAGTTDVDVTSVLDDLLGELLTTPPNMLGAGDTLMLSGGPVFIDQDTASAVNVSANVSGDPSVSCPAQDTVVVTVDPAPQLACSAIKPITQLSMVWDGPSGVDVLSEGGQLFSNVQNGNKITFNTAGLGNDVDLTLSGAISGTSRFHVSCSDNAMNGPEDCGIGRQGDGKDNNSSRVNDWLLDAMIGGTGSFSCNLPNTGVVNPTTGGGGTAAVSAEFKQVKGKEYKFDIINTGNTDVIIERITLSWPTAVNGDLKEIKRGKSKIYDTDTPVSPATITSWQDKQDKRKIKSGETKEFKYKFENDADKNQGSYASEIEFDTGTVINLP